MAHPTCHLVVVSSGSPCFPFPYPSKRLLDVAVYFTSGLDANSAASLVICHDTPDLNKISVFEEKNYEWKIVLVMELKNVQRSATK